MTDYVAPIEDMRFVLNHVVDLAGLARLPKFEHVEADLVDAALTEAARLAKDVLGPLNRVGDTTGSRVENGVVRTPPGFADAYRQFAEGGWNGVPFDPETGGGGLPWAVAMATQEMFTSANMAMMLCPLLTQGAVEAIAAHGTEAQKAMYLEKLVSGAWTGTMNLTEPNAGSDVGALRSRAVPRGDGSWAITGQKIFITYGEHDMAENIVHLVLARTPNSPPGTKGISLFIVPKFFVNPDGSLGERNDLRVVSLEHKLGIHASPTCVMSFGDGGGAVGWLLGEENKGMRCMFTMMNNARLSVGLQGVAIAERAYQQALAYARDRKQGRHASQPATESVAIIEHADVRRNLMLMKSQIEAARALAYVNAEALDQAHGNPDKAAAEQGSDLAELLTPLTKAWGTDLGVELTSIGLQIHGGMGFVEETGAAQHYRDARITPIYEGTNGIQALDLVGRKLPMKGGQVARDLIARMAGLDAELAAAGEALAPVRTQLNLAVAALAEATDWMLDRLKAEPEAALAGATPYLRMFATTVGGYLLALSAIAAQKLIADGEDRPFLRNKLVTARFYATQVLPQVAGLLLPATGGTTELAEVTPDTLAA
ncbi:MAG: acyl-CoA dehydrogenase [Alphaproteobacteria bacterium]|jgi:alkylation response protein AidB-like acyl-CoA dehydrogenase|nr:acyl-CoA dehydrogenase [Alphaproteobacteria bacterium]